jgi:hypothetical protein
MSTTIRRRENGTDDAPFDTSLRRHVDLGDDGEGYTHHLDRHSATVHRIDTRTGERERTTDLTVRDEPAPRALEIYIHHVSQRVGWTVRRKFIGADLFRRVA